MSNPSHNNPPDTLDTFGTSGTLAFTLIELLTAMAVLTLTVIVSLGFIFSVRNKAILRHDLDQLSASLRYARQQSIIAYHGHTYSTTLNPDGTIIINPDGSRRQLNKHSRFADLQEPLTISFAKLTGAASKSLEITLTRSDVQGTITITAPGHISISQITRSQ